MADTPFMTWPMDYFNDAFTYTMLNEGSFQYTNNPNDSGGATKYGVSLSLLQSYRKDARLGPDDIKALTEDDARVIALNVFWNPLNCSLALRKQDAMSIFDQGYLDGVPSAAMTAQLALKQMGLLARADGILGPVSWGLINECQPMVFVREFVSLLNNRYWKLAEVNPKDINFLDGWIKRSNRLLTIS